MDPSKKNRNAYGSAFTNFDDEQNVNSKDNKNNSNQPSSGYHQLDSLEDRVKKETDTKRSSHTNIRNREGSTKPPYITTTSHSHQLSESKDNNDEESSIESSEETESSQPQSVSQVNRGRNWNEEFQALLRELHSPNVDIRQTYIKLSELEKDFIESAKTYGKIIMAEYCLHHDAKTIKKASLSGIAGGDKYICNNILFKFAVDSNGLYCSDQNAMKAAGHDLRNLNQLLELGLPGVCFPLMCTIDWCGFRLVAMPLLPIDKYTLIYGSSDGGCTVFNKHPEFEKLMKEAAEKLNLAGHMCGLDKNTCKFLYTCADCEGHLGRDNRFYMIDIARMFPPEWTDPKTVASSPSLLRWYLFRQLRPELVRKWKTPLNPDVFSRFLDTMPSDLRIKDQREVESCTKDMLNRIIPEFAKRLSVHYADNNIESLQQLTSDRLLLELHDVGINIRHLGLVRKCLESSSNCSTVKGLILLEMCCRVIKEELNERMRNEMKRIVTPSSLPFDRIIINFYNMMFSNIQFWSHINLNETKSSHETLSIKTLILKKFGKDALTEKELNPRQAIYPRDPVCLVTRLQQLLGVKLYSSAKEKLQYLFRHSPERAEQLSVEDIEQRDVRVKHLNCIFYAQAISDLTQALKTENREKKIRLLENSCRYFEMSRLRSLYQPDNNHLKEVVNMWGDALLEYGLLMSIDATSKDPFRESRNTIKLAKHYFEMSLEKYSWTNSGDRVLRLADEGSRKLFQLIQQHQELTRHHTSPSSSSSSSSSSQATHHNSPRPALLPQVGSGAFTLTPVEILSFLKKIMGDDYCSKILNNSQFQSDSAMSRWATILYHSALQCKEIPNESKVLFQVAGKLYLNAIKLCPSKFEPLSSWIHKVRDEEVGHILYLREYQPSSQSKFEVATQSNKPIKEERNVITKFDSSWLPLLSLETFVTMVKNTALRVLILRGTQICPEVINVLPSLQDHFQDLTLFSIQ